MSTPTDSQELPWSKRCALDVPSFQIYVVSLQITGLHFDTKNILYAYSIAEIALNNTNFTIFW